MNDGRTNNQAGDADIRTRRWGLSLVWLVPIVAVLIGLSMLYQSWQQSGPTIKITFQTAGSLTAEKSPIKYRNVVIGEVTDVTLSKDHKNVIVTAELNREAASFTREDSRYWVVRPRVGAEGVSGLDTLLSGDFIAADPGTSSKRSETFSGLESPPPVTYGEPGTRFRLKARNLGSLDIGSPVYFRKVRVGQVVSFKLDESGDGVNLDIFVNAPNDKFVTSDTRFWNASGIKVGVNANGLEVNSESLLSVLSGGVAFGSPPKSDDTPADPVVTSDNQFQLFDDQDTALAPGKGPSQAISMRFDQSLRGLSSDAPVYFMGKKIGEVSTVSLDYDEQNRTFPVIVEADVYPRLMGKAYRKLTQSQSGKNSQKDAVLMMFDQFVKQGLKAEARKSNLLTGQLHIALEFHPDDVSETVRMDTSGKVAVIPTRATSLDKLQDQLADLVERFSAIPFESMAANLDGSLAELKKTLASVNNDVLPSTRTTLEGIDELMSQMKTTLQTATDSFAYDSPERQRIGQALDELERMSRSVRELSDYLRRHPEALIRGRPEQDSTGVTR
ncbi:MlaD family protein [Marinobacter sp. BGYM27]|uniref:PqiB family protein n=1 Tax=Marinobacter sp. BGYM27 TaxID=2975597 RepID=UPI0021A7BE75|nr:MlaD family protein [Marinobacter sp. BGYM27]MDG5498394.1 MlaD family protein [Marinobacter sp. BGYM27]